MAQETQTGALYQPRGVGWGGRREGGSEGRGCTYIHIWLIHVKVWQKTTKFCKAIILQLKKNNKKKKKKKRWEHTEELYKGLNEPDNQDGGISHLELEHSGVWDQVAQESSTISKLVEVMEFQPFKILKDDAIKGLHSICQQIWKTHQWPQDW